MGKKFAVEGKVVDTQTGNGIKGLRVEAWDKDLVFDDALGNALTDDSGAFNIAYRESSFSDRYSEKQPDIFFKVYLAEKLLETTEDALIHNASRYEKQVEIPIRFYEKEKEEINTYELSGKLLSKETIDYSKAKMTVQAFVGEREIASADVEENGAYKLAFADKKLLSAVELRVIPKLLATPRYHKAPGLGLKKTMGGSYFRKKENEKVYKAQYSMQIPYPFIEFLWKITKAYHMHGAVYATTFQDVGGVPTPIGIQPVPGAKIEFFEADKPFLWLFGTEPTISESYLGEAFTGPDGSYDFTFDFTYNPWFLFYLFNDTVPDVRARISQFTDGAWTQVYEGPVDWNIAEDFNRSYFIPEEEVIPEPVSEAKPLVGFRYISCGLLPVDNTRIKKGYATAESGDPARIAGVSHQPFCGRLRLFGLFAESDNVQTYKVQLAEANEDGPTGSWTDVTDPLHNRKWDDTNKKWLFNVLGPDPLTGRYKNIDIEPEYDWHEHALKVTWYSANVANGYYAIRVIGYNAADAEVGIFYMPVVRIDNTRPDASLDIISPAVSECGYMTLDSTRNIAFKVTAHDSEGHMLRYHISCSRGKHPQAAGSKIQTSRPDPNTNWTGESNHSDVYHVNPLPSELADCPSVAYNAELHVYGASTDGYNVTPGSQHAKREMNLIVSE